MAPSKIRKAIGVVKDQTSIGLAIVFSGNCRSDLEVAIIKATRHEENPRHESHVREIICLTSFSTPMVSTCVSAISRRLSRTRNWVVALKTLMLAHRLIQDGDHTYAEQIFFAKRHGKRFLSMSDFRDSSASRDFSNFIRMYALYLDQQLQFRVYFRTRSNSRYLYRGDDDRQIVVHGAGSARSPPVHEMTNEDVLSRVHQLLQLFEKFLACRPTGAANCNNLVSAALYTLLKESFQIFYDMTEVIATLTDRFMQLQVPDMIRVHGIFSSVSKQYDDIAAFYDWCKRTSIMPPSNFPNVKKIPKEKLDTMNDFIRQKSEMLQTKNMNPKPVEEEEKEDEAKPEEDENAMKALVPVDYVCVESAESRDAKSFEPMETEEEKKIQDIGDLLNLDDDTPSTEEHGNMLALALFDDLTTVPETATNPWEAFNDSTEDWETKLVESARHLSNQRASLRGGFDTLMLDSMYQYGAMTQVVAYSGCGGSASSVALRSHAMLALPAPPMANNGATKTDPFAASLTIAPPSYVQISEMEEKQRLLVQEQLYWQQFARNGMQGHALTNLHQQYPNQYVTSGCTKAW